MPLWTEKDLEDMTGPSLGKVFWKQFCHEIGAEYLEGNPILVRVRGCDIVFHLFGKGKLGKPFLCIKTFYKSIDGFQFGISHNNFFYDLGKKFFKLQDIEIGSLPFDKDFIIKGNNESKVRALFSDQNIRQLLEAEPSVQLQVRVRNSARGQRDLVNKLPRGFRELFLEIPLSSLDTSLESQVNRLKSIYKLFVLILEQLCPPETENEVNMNTETKGTFRFCTGQLSLSSVLTVASLSAFCGGIAFALVISICSYTRILRLAIFGNYLVNLIVFPLGGTFFAALFAMIGFPIYAWICKKMCGQKLQGVFRNPSNTPLF